MNNKRMKYTKSAFGGTNGIKIEIMISCIIFRKEFIGTRRIFS
jgi:hypothetical protein